MPRERIMESNPGTLNAFQLATLLTFLSDDTVENTALETLQKKLNSAFNTKDHVKVSSYIFYSFFL